MEEEDEINTQQQQHVSGEANMLISKTTLNNVIHVVGERLGALASPIQFVMAFLFSFGVRARSSSSSHLSKNAKEGNSSLARERAAKAHNERVGENAACVNAMRASHESTMFYLGSMEPSDHNNQCIGHSLSLIVSVFGLARESAYTHARAHSPIACTFIKT